MAFEILDFEGITIGDSKPKATLTMVSWRYHRNRHITNPIDQY